MVIAVSFPEMTIQPVLIFFNRVLGGVLKKWTLRQGFSHSNLLRKYPQGTPVRTRGKQDTEGEEDR